MRRTSRKNDFDSLNRGILVIGILFIVSAAFGTYLNKAGIDSNDLMSKIAPAADYYKTEFKVMEIVYTNIKADILFLGLIALFGLFVVTIPLSVVVFVIKGVSIGYTINSCILVLNSGGTNLVALVIIKNLAIVPGGILLVLLSVNYFKEMIHRMKKVSNRNIFSLVKRYILNVLIVLLVFTGLQIAVNTICIGIMKFLAI